MTLDTPKNAMPNVFDMVIDMPLRELTYFDTKSQRLKLLMLRGNSITACEGPRGETTPDNYKTVGHYAGDSQVRMLIKDLDFWGEFGRRSSRIDYTKVELRFREFELKLRPEMRRVIEKFFPRRLFNGEKRTYTFSVPANELTIYL